MARSFSLMIIIACAPLVLGACQVASGLDKLHPSMTEAPQGTLVEAGTAVETAQPGFGTTATMEPGSAGATAMEMNAGDGPASPSAGVGGMSGATSPVAGMMSSPADPQDNNNNAMPMTAGMAGNAAMPPVDPGLADPQTAMGTPTATTNRDMPTAGAGGDVAAQAGAVADPPPVAGSSSTETMMPPEPMCVSPFPGGSCDTAPQCGCADGQNCAYLVTLDIPSCVRAGSVRLNQHCDLTADCQLGLQCFGGACLKLCDPNEQGCENGATCAQGYYGRQPITGLYTCNSNCNLVAPQRESGTLAACGVDLTCVWSGDGSTCMRPDSDAGRHGEICADSHDCAPSYTCMDSGTCARWCETAQDCPVGFRCDATSASVAGVNFGLCRPNCRDTREISCETNPQCGCESGMTCDYLYRTDSLLIAGCREAGRTPAYYACDTNSECEVGTSCVGSRCEPFCERDADCGAYAQCIQVTNSAVSGAPPIPGFTVCRRPCDPADLTSAHGAYEACPAGHSCEARSDGRSFCRDADPDAARGSACQNVVDCAIGDSCSLGSGCSKQCRTDYDCASGYRCLSFNPRVYAADEEWGICVVSAATQ